jgi:hypothetical protein
MCGVWPERTAAHRVRRGERLRGGAARGAVRAGADRGLTLVEVLVAACVTSVILAAAWPWLWNAAGVSRRATDREQARSAAAYAARILAADVGEATALLPPPAGVPSSRALQLRHVHLTAGAETVLVRWDPAKCVLWRKTSSTYLADRVTAFAVSYVGREGDALEPGDAFWPAAVARIAVSLTVTVGAEACTVRRSLPWPGP